MWEHSLLKIIFLENDHSGVTVKVGALKNNKTYTKQTETLHEYLRVHKDLVLFLLSFLSLFLSVFISENCKVIV